MRTLGIRPLPIAFALALCFLAGARLGPAQEALEQEEAGGRRAEGYRPVAEPDIRAALEKILTRPEYRRDEAGVYPGPARRTIEEPAPERKHLEAPGWLKRFLDWLAKWLRSGASLADSSVSSVWLLLLKALAYLLVAAIVVAIFRLVVTTLVGLHRSRGERAETAIAVGQPSVPPPGELAADEYAARALGLASQGDLKGAIRQLLLGGMSWTERHELIRHRKGLTNRDYLRALGREPLRRDVFNRIVADFEKVYFGRRAATAEAFRDCLKQYRDAFQGS